MTAIPIRRRPADEILDEQWPILAAAADKAAMQADSRAEQVAQMGTVMSVGLAIERLTEEVRRLRQLDDVVTSFMLGRCGGRSVAQAQQHVREIR